MSKTIKLLGLLLLLPISLIALSDKELATSINLSGKQRMLSQKMTKESFLIRSHIDTKENIERLEKSSLLFNKILVGLKEGDKKLGLVPSQNTNIEKELKRVEDLWTPFYHELKLVMKGEAKDATYEILEKNNIPLLQEVNKLVSLYTSLNSENHKFKLANDINLAGKQRMLTQKMGKDLLFVRNNFNKKSYLNDFKASQELFTQTLDGLLHGSQALNLVGTKLPKITNQLKVVEGLWREEQKRFKGAIANQNLKETIDGLDRLLVEMNQAVTYYTQSVNRQTQRFKLASLIGDFMDKSKILKKRVNLSGRQRMLTQRITKLSLLIDSNIDAQANRERLEKYSTLYDKTLNAFKRGDKDLGCIPANGKEIKEQIAVIEEAWRPFYSEIKNIIQERDKDGHALAFVVRKNEHLLKESNELVKRFETSNRALNYLDKARLRVVNVAGRQRMLTQKMTKEKLLIANGERAYEAKLKKTIQLFDDSLKSLIEGNTEASIPKSSNPEIKEQLHKIETLWKGLKPLYRKAKPTRKELDRIIKENPTLLFEMNKMVKMAEVTKEY